MDWRRHHRIQLAVKYLLAGEVIAYPTEAVWGLGCDPMNPRAVARLLAMKRRPMDKGVILIAADIAQLEPYLGALDEQQRKTLAETWPGNLTWIVPCSDRVPRWIRGRHNSVAVRVSAHPVVTALCHAFGGPIVSTSANPAGLLPARDRFRVHRYFPRQLATITPGEVGSDDKPSEIRDLLTGAVLRA